MGLGVEKLRITGGEPLVRRDLPDLIAMLAALRRPDGGSIDLTLTTNGSALRALAGPLVAAGLQRVTVSLDSLDPEVFGAMNGIDFPVSRVLDGIDAALEAGLAPVKINMVVRRGVNEDSIVPMAAWARDTGVILRFIEYMDVGHSNGWRLDDVVPAGDIVERLGARWPVEPADPSYRGEVADRWRYLDGRGEFGVISSVTVPFCSECTRARLSADGQLYTCLFAVDGHDVRARPARRASRTRRSPPSSSGSGCAAAIATPSFGRRRRPRCRRSRCSRWAADRREHSAIRAAPPPPSTPCPQRRTFSWIRTAAFDGTWWITALTRPPSRPYRRSCPKGPTGPQDPRSHQGPSIRRRSLRALRCPARVAVSPRSARGFAPGGT